MCEKKIVSENQIKQGKMTMKTNIFIVYATRIVQGVVTCSKVFKTNTAIRPKKV